MKRPGYLWRLLAATPPLTPEEAIAAHVRHNGWCPTMHGGVQCACYPFILVKHNREIYYIDEQGRLVKKRRGLLQPAESGKKSPRRTL